MTHSRVPFLAIYDFHPQIHRIVGKELLDLLRRDVVAGDVSYVRFIPIEKPVRQPCYPTLVYIRRMYPRKIGPDRRPARTCLPIRVRLSSLAGRWATSGTPTCQIVLFCRLQ